MIFTFWHKRKIYNSDPYNVLLVIATSIHVLLMTSFVVQGHIYGIQDVLTFFVITEQMFYLIL